MIEAIQDYISHFPAETQAKLNEMHSCIREALPEAEERNSYQMPAFRYLKKNLIYYAGYDKHIGLYPGTEAIVHFREELKPFKHAKGSIQFPLNAPIPGDLIQQIVLFRKSAVESEYAASKKNVGNKV